MSSLDAIDNNLPVLQVKGLGKIYARRTSDTRKKLGAIAGKALWGGRPRQDKALKGSQFWAVQNVSFDLARGEAIGIIGLNGSGKTTLLRMLAGQIPVDAGEVVVNGTSAAMIDLQAGFQPSASGHENIFLRAAALGFTRKKTQTHIKEIIEFSELGDAIHAPLATYSSGMKMRLAFSIMATVSPDILFIDEVLAVGDFAFRQKCLAKVREMRSRSAFVFVSHAMGDISRFCNRVIVMHKGKVAFMGDPDAAIEFHLSQQAAENQPPQLRLAMPDNAGKEISKPFSLHEKVVAKGLDFFSPASYQNQDFVASVKYAVDGVLTDTVYKQCLDKLEFSVVARLKQSCRRLIFGFTILTEAGEGITGVASDSQNLTLTLDQAREVFSSVVIDKLTLMPGKYVVYFNMREGVELIYRSKLFEIVVDTPPHNTFGVMLLSHSWNVGETQEQ